MPSSADDVGRLRAAIEAHERFVTERGRRSASEFLAEHEQLRGLLEPLIAGARPGPPPSPAGPSVLGDFRLLGELGRGGMGVVYDAEQISLGRRVAVKVLPGRLALDPDRRARFVRESRLAASLDHPGIAKVISADAADDVIWFAMERIDGVPLDRVLTRTADIPAATMTGGRLASAVDEVARQCSVEDTWPEAADARKQSTVWRAGHVDTVVRIGAQIAEALQHAHERGVVHRDVKPANVLLRRDGSAVLTDFGLARDLNAPSLTLTGDFLGTPSYCAPEQLAGDRATTDHRVDIFALGVTLYELLTHRRPFEASSSDEVRARILTVEPRRPRRLNPRIPTDLNSVLMMALDKDPDRRYQTAAAMAADLRAVAAGQPVRARPVRAQTRAWRWCRRNPWAAATLAASVAVVILLLVMRAQLGRANVDKMRMAGVALARAQDFGEALAELMPLERWAPGAETHAALEDLFRLNPCLASHALVSEADERVIRATFSADGQRLLTTHEHRRKGEPRSWRLRLWDVPAPESPTLQCPWQSGACTRLPSAILDVSGQTVAWIQDERTVSVGGPAHETSTILFSEPLVGLCPASVEGSFGVLHASSARLCDATGPVGREWPWGSDGILYYRPTFVGDLLVWQRDSDLVCVSPGSEPRVLAANVGTFEFEFDPNDATGMTVATARTITTWRSDSGTLHRVGQRRNPFPDGIWQRRTGSGGRESFDETLLARLADLPLLRARVLSAALRESTVGADRGPYMVAVESRALRLWGMSEPRQVSSPAHMIETARFEPTGEGAPATHRLWAVGLMTLAFHGEGPDSVEDVQMPRQVREVQAAGRTPTFCGMAFDPGRAVLACARGSRRASRDVPGWVFVWPADGLSGAEARSYGCRSDPGWIEFSPERGLLAVAECDGGIEVWRYDPQRRELTLRVALPPLSAEAARLSCVRFVGDRFLLASVSGHASPGAILRWDLDDPGARPVPMLVTPEVHTALRCLAVSPDRDLVATGGDDRIVRAMRIVWLHGKPELRPAWHQEHDAKVSAVAFVKRGDTFNLVSADALGAIRLWDAVSGDELGMVREILESEDEGIMSLDFSPDGRHLAAARYGGGVLLWDMERPRRCLDRNRACADQLLRLQAGSR